MSVFVTILSNINFISVFAISLISGDTAIGFYVNIK